LAVVLPNSLAGVSLKRKIDTFCKTDELLSVSVGEHKKGVIIVVEKNQP